jgi:hypothetical protein
VLSSQTVGLPAIDQLGHELDEAWREQNYDPSCFPDLCVEKLTAASVHRTLTPKDILAWAVQGELPEQFDQLSRFGQPPITVFRSRRFIIDTLFWLDGTTNIHDHAFSGGFQVLSGSSIETIFSFESSRVVDGHLAFGRLDHKRSILRRRGDANPIVAGSTYIHGLFHLDRPSVTLLIRSLQEPLLPLVYQYQPCGIAWNPFFRDPTLNRMMEVVELMNAAGEPSFEKVVGDLVARSDLYTIYRIMRACAGIQDQRRLDALLDRVRDREAAATFSAGLVEERTAGFLRARRGIVHEPELRFLLAVLLNSHRGDDSLRLVSAFAGEGVDPASEIARWLRRLSKITMRLQAGGSPWEPNVLGLPEFDDALEGAHADTLAKRERVFTATERAFLDRVRALPHLTALFDA